MSIWKKTIHKETIAQGHGNTAIAHLGIEITAIGEDSISGRMPVDHRTKQPFGLLHGGCSVVLAETLGSLAAYYAAPPGQQVVGLEINANHLRPATSGWVTGTARPFHIGRSTQVWQIEIVDDGGKRVCVSRITMAILG